MPTLSVEVAIEALACLGIPERACHISAGVLGETLETLRFERLGLGTCSFSDRAALSGTVLYSTAPLLIRVPLGVPLRFGRTVGG